MCRVVSGFAPKASTFSRGYSCWSCSCRLGRERPRQPKVHPRSQDEGTQASPRSPSWAAIPGGQGVVWHEGKVQEGEEVFWSDQAKALGQIGMHPAKGKGHVSQQAHGSPLPSLLGQTPPSGLHKESACRRKSSVVPGQLPLPVSHRATLPGSLVPRKVYQGETQPSLGCRRDFCLGHHPSLTPSTSGHWKQWDQGPRRGEGLSREGAHWEAAGQGRYLTAGHNASLSLLTTSVRPAILAPLVLFSKQRKG